MSDELICSIVVGVVQISLTLAGLTQRYYVTRYRGSHFTFLLSPPLPGSREELHD